MDRLPDVRTLTDAELEALLFDAAAEELRRHADRRLSGAQVGPRRPARQGEGSLG